MILMHIFFGKIFSDTTILVYTIEENRDIALFLKIFYFRIGWFKPLKKHVSFVLINLNILFFINKATYVNRYSDINC